MKEANRFIAMTCPSLRFVRPSICLSVCLCLPGHLRMQQTDDYACKIRRTRWRRTENIRLIGPYIKGSFSIQARGVQKHMHIRKHMHIHEHARGAVDQELPVWTHWTKFGSCQTFLMWWWPMTTKAGLWRGPYVPPIQFHITLPSHYKIPIGF